jgi:hypothetical protein
LIRIMSNSTKSTVSKLKRVLVAGGVALAGAAGSAGAADDKAPLPKAEKVKEKPKDEAKAKAPEKPRTDSKAGESSGGGVQGW